MIVNLVFKNEDMEFDVLGNVLEKLSINGFYVEASTLLEEVFFLILDKYIDVEAPSKFKVDVEVQLAETLFESLYFDGDYSDLNGLFRYVSRLENSFAMKKIISDIRSCLNETVYISNIDINSYAGDVLLITLGLGNE